MTTINNVYINALLADATYALDDTVGNGYPKEDLIEKLEPRMTSALAEYIGNNFTVVTHVDTRRNGVKEMGSSLAIKHPQG